MEPRELPGQVPGRIGGAAAVAALAALVYRLPYGVSHRDEAFYSAMPYSFLLGNRPYVDELAMHQNAALLLLPFYRAYLAIAGSMSGIILFNRYLYLIYAVACACAAFVLGRRLVRPGEAALAAALVGTFSYFNIFALSYNTLGTFGFFCGLVLGANALLGPRPGFGLFGAGLFFLSAVFAYPAAAAAVLFYGLTVLAWLYWVEPRAALRHGAWGLAAALCIGAATLVPWALWIGAAGFARLLEFSRSMGYVKVTVLEKLNFFGSVAWAEWHWSLLGFAAVFLCVPLACRFLKRGLWLVALAACVAAWLCYRAHLGANLATAPTPAAVFLTASPVLAPVCVGLNRGWSRGRFVLLLLWAPSVLLMLAVAYASANGFHSASLGSLGALLAGMLSFSALVGGMAQRSPELKTSYQLLLGAVLGSSLLIQIHSLYAVAYDGEPRFGYHDTRVTSGPFRGTYTTKAQAELTVSVHRDLKMAAKDARSITVFDDFATGYLSTPLQPRTFTQWIVWCMSKRFDEQIMRETFGDSARLPDIVLKIGMRGTSEKLWKKYERGHYRTLVERPELGYVILRRTGT